MPTQSSMPQNNNISNKINIKLNDKIMTLLFWALIYILIGFIHGLVLYFALPGIFATSFNPLLLAGVCCLISVAVFVVTAINKDIEKLYVEKRNIFATIRKQYKLNTRSTILKYMGGSLLAIVALSIVYLFVVLIFERFLQHGFIASAYFWQPMVSATVVFSLLFLIYSAVRPLFDDKDRQTKNEMMEDPDKGSESVNDPQQEQSQQDSNDEEIEVPLTIAPESASASASIENTQKSEKGNQDSGINKTSTAWYQSLSFRLTTIICVTIASALMVISFAYFYQPLIGPIVLLKWLYPSLYGGGIAGIIISSILAKDKSNISNFWQYFKQCFSKRENNSLRRVFSSTAVLSHNVIFGFCFGAVIALTLFILPHSYLGILGVNGFQSILLQISVVTTITQAGLSIFKSITTDWKGDYQIEMTVIPTMNSGSVEPIKASSSDNQGNDETTSLSGDDGDTITYTI